MIAEENLPYKPIQNVSVPKANPISLIISLMKQTVPYFKSFLLSDFYKKSQLNEDDFTQIYIEQVQILARKFDYQFNVNGQYRDISNLSKGISDFYFYPNEQSISTSSIFSVECKRLPPPDKKREKEYVIGEKNNGGIERYKTEKHGKGLNECGLLGFIEGEDSKYWFNEINSWIQDLTKSSENWSKDEILSEKEVDRNYTVLMSIVHRKNDNMRLTHLWLTLK